MKKLIAMLLSAVMLIPAAVYACEEADGLPKMTEAAGECGEAWVAMEQTTACLFGKLSPAEKTDVWPAQTAGGKRVRGMTAQGITRIKGEMRYMVVDGAVCGLTKVYATVTVREEYREIVESVVARHMGEDAKLTAETMIACTLYRTCGTVSHMMAGMNADKIAVGCVLFAGADMQAVLYLCDWDADGQADLVFGVNPGTPRKETPAPEPTPKPRIKVVYVEKKEKKQEEACGGGSGCLPKCVKIIQITIGGIGDRFQQIVFGKDGGWADFSKMWQKN